MLGKVYLGRYETVRFLGQGSMGRVYLAHALDRPRQVVIKVMHDHVADQPHFRELFQREISCMAQFRHAYAAELLDASLDDPQGPFLVLDYLPGITLEQLLEREPRLKLARVAHFLDHLCHALQAAHAVDLIHRDLKPANLMVVEPDTPAEGLRVLDFGLALLSAKPHIPLERLRGDEDAFLVGTPMYICPEQVRGDAMDHRGDLYSVGTILFEMLTGKPPFSLDDADRLLNAHLSEPPPRFADLGLGRAYPPAVEAVVQRCLAKYPNERPQTADELANLFAEAAGRRRSPPPPPPPSAPSRSAEMRMRPPSAPQTPADPHAFECQFVAWMPEKVAVVKLRGFVEDLGGRVIASEPGLIRVRLREPRPVPPTTTGRRLLTWLGRLSQPQPQAVAPPDPVEVELHLEKKHDAKPNSLQLTVRFRPAEDRPLRDPPDWRSFCEKVQLNLRSYLMAQS